MDYDGFDPLDPHDYSYPTQHCSCCDELVSELRAEVELANQERQWVRRKWGIAADATLQEVQATMHVMHPRATSERDLYERSLARAEIERDAARAEAERLREERAHFRMRAAALAARVEREQPVVKAAMACVDNPAFAGVCDQDVELERAVGALRREFEVDVSEDARKVCVACERPAVVARAGEVWCDEHAPEGVQR